MKWLRKLLARLAPKTIHEHRVVRIWKLYQPGDLVAAYWVEMDCPVMPEKVLVTTECVPTGMSLDPHFSNKEIVARFPPTKEGWEMATDLTYTLANDRKNTLRGEEG